MKKVEVLFRGQKPNDDLVKYFAGILCDIITFFNLFFGKDFLIDNIIFVNDPDYKLPDGHYPIMAFYKNGKKVVLFNVDDTLYSLMNARNNFNLMRDIIFILSSMFIKDKSLESYFNRLKIKTSEEITFTVFLNMVLYIFDLGYFSPKIKMDVM